MYRQYNNNLSRHLEVCGLTTLPFVKSSRHFALKVQNTKVENRNAATTRYAEIRGNLPAILANYNCW